MVRSIWLWGLIAMLMFLSGCAILDAVNQDKMNDETEVRIEKGEKELKELEGGIQKKKEANKKLLSQLQVELQALEQELQEYNEIKKSKKGVLSEVEALKKRLADLDDQLSQLKRKLAYGSDGPDGEVLGEKKRQIAELRKDIETYLWMGSN